MSSEKPKVDYTKGDPEKMLKADLRRQAERYGQIPTLEAQRKAAEQRRPQALPEKPDFMAGDAEKLKAAREKLGALYPPKKQEEVVPVPEKKKEAA